jgi:hypothetical protein
MAFYAIEANLAIVGSINVDLGSNLTLKGDSILEWAIDAGFIRQSGSKSWVFSSFPYTCTGNREFREFAHLIRVQKVENFRFRARLGSIS